jgi:hypothetical protein
LMLVSSSSYRESYHSLLTATSAHKPFSANDVHKTAC